MAVRRNTGHSQSEPIWKRLSGRLTRHDVVLTAIPLVFAVALVAATVLSLSYAAALAAGAVGSTGLLVDALFVNPPIERESDR